MKRWMLLYLLVPQALAAPGDVIFAEGFEGRLSSDWRSSRNWAADIGTHTAETGRYALFLHGDAVDVTLKNRRARLEDKKARLRFWVRRGSDQFSEDPDVGEDLRVLYRDRSRRWQTLVQYSGDGTPGQVFIFDQELPDDALHNDFRLRFSLLDGSGSGWDFWHVDNVRITESGEQSSRPVVGHDGAGSYCAEEKVSLQVVDDAGNPNPNFEGQVIISTSTNVGRWRRLAGNGSLVGGADNDGRATYNFVATDAGEAALGLTYSSGAPVLDVDMTIVSAGATDNDAEGALTFVPQSFVVTAGEILQDDKPPFTDPIPPQTAETKFQMHLTAVSGACGVTTDYVGNHSFDVWQSLINPNTGGRTLSLNGSDVGMNVSQSNRTILSFTKGRAVVTGFYADAGLLSIGFKEVENGTSVFTNEFVVRPAGLVITEVLNADGVPNPETDALDGRVFTKAGHTMRVTVEARGAAGSLLPNFGRESPPEMPDLAAQAIVPAGANSRLSNGALFRSVVPGRFVNQSVSFDDVGIISLQARLADGNYLGSGDVRGNVVRPVGRFAIDRFVLTRSNVSAACNGFTYMDQPALSLGIEVEARNARGERTVNYDQVLFGAVAQETVSVRAENANNGIDLGARLRYTPPVWTQGRWRLAATDASFAKKSEPDGAFDELQLSVSVTEVLEAASLTNLDTNPTTPGNCIVDASCTASSIGTTQMRFGRLTQLPMQGPEDKPLSIPIVAEYWQQGFRINDLDSCTTYDTTAAILSDHSGDLQAGETFLTAPLSQFSMVEGIALRDQRPTLSAPGVDNRGSVLVTNPAPTWLQYDWRDSGLVSPRARATFGQYRGHDRVLVWREVSR